MTLPSVEEPCVVVVAHDPDWARVYAREARLVAAAIGHRCAAIEHFGSTSVAKLLAKPIIDILVASTDGTAPTSSELEALAALGYTFLGEDARRPGRYFWRKRESQSFNLSIVPFRSDLWGDNLLVRDYLRTHPPEVSAYAQIKRRAIAASPHSLLGYQNYKRDFMRGLRQRALEWRGRHSE